MQSLNGKGNLLKLHFEKFNLNFRDKKVAIHFVTLNHEEQKNILLPSKLQQQRDIRKMQMKLKMEFPLKNDRLL